MEYIMNMGITFIVLIVILYIGSSVAVMTGSSSDELLADQNVNMTNYDWYLEGPTHAGNMMVVYSEFLAVAVAVVGGMAIFYVLNYLGIFNDILE